MNQVSRRLATILATDCVGFSAHMEINEVGTLESLNTCRSIIDPIIAGAGGRIFHTAGDSVIAEFSSPVECVEAAYRFQIAISDYSKSSNRRYSLPVLEWRVGIHIDDIIIEGDNVFGSGVNIAARLEAACDPGRILLSRFVAEQVKKRLELSIIADGTRALKNISENFEVFTIGNVQDYNSGQPLKDIERANNGVDKNLTPRLAVLPFTNQSKDEEKAFLVDGIVEDLITEFSMIHELEVLSRQTSIDLGKVEKTFSEISTEFQLDFFVTGAIRSSGNRVRISVELSDAHDGGVIWSKKFDKVLDDVFEVQDEIVQATAGVLLGKMEVRSLERSKRKPTNNMTSYEFLLRGKEQHHMFQKKANELALSFFDQAIEADPNNGKAYAWKACTLGQSIARGFSAKPTSEVFDEAKLNVEKAKTINENDFECHRLLCAVYMFTEQFQLSLEHGKRSHKLNPNDPRVLSGYGDILVRLNQCELGIDCFKKALELDPVPMGQINSDNRLRDLAFGYFCAEDYKLCVEQLNNLSKKIERDDLILAYCAKRLGLKEISRLDQRVSWKDIVEGLHFADQSKIEVLNDFIELQK